MAIIVQIDPQERSATLRGVHSLCAGESSELVLTGVPDADTATLSLRLYRDRSEAEFVATARRPGDADPPQEGFVAVEGRAALRRAVLDLRSESVASWASDVFGQSGSDGPEEAPRPPETAWMVVADMSRVWAACEVPFLLRPMSPESADVAPTLPSLVERAREAAESAERSASAASASAAEASQAAARAAASMDGKADLVDGRVPASQLPSYVDDVVEVAALPASGESGKLYVVTGTNVVYRWSGSSFVEVSASRVSVSDIAGGKRLTVVNGGSTKTVDVPENYAIKEMAREVCLPAPTTSGVRVVSAVVGFAEGLNVLAGKAVAFFSSLASKVGEIVINATTSRPAWKDAGNALHDLAYKSEVPATASAVGALEYESPGGTFKAAYDSTTGKWGFRKQGAFYALPDGEGANAGGTFAMSSDIPDVSGKLNVSNGVATRLSNIGYLEVKKNANDVNGIWLDPDGRRIQAGESSVDAWSIDHAGITSYDGNGRRDFVFPTASGGVLALVSDIPTTAAGVGAVAASDGTATNLKADGLKRKVVVDTGRLSVTYGQWTDVEVSPVTGSSTDWQPQDQSFVLRVLTANTCAVLAAGSETPTVLAHAETALPWTLVTAADPDTPVGTVAAVTEAQWADVAPLASPAFTGAPTAPTPAAGDDSAKVATTAFVQAALGGADPTNKLDSTSAAPDFSASATYDVGSYVTYLGALYECVVAKTTASATTPDQDIYDSTHTTNHWKVTDMTTPDATLDVTSAKKLRVVGADGTLLWQQGYNLNSTSSATQSDGGVNCYAFAQDAVAPVALSLPAVTSGKVGDFILDVTNPSLGSPFSTTASYAVGDRVIYNGAVYTCTTAHTGAWSASDFGTDPTYAAFSASSTYAVDALAVYGGKLWKCHTAVSSAGAWTGTANWQTASFALPATASYVVPAGQNLTETLTIGPGMCELYFTLTAFSVNGKPTWKVVRQDVEAGA